MIFKDKIKSHKTSHNSIMALRRNQFNGQLHRMASYSDNMLKSDLISPEDKLDLLNIKHLVDNILYNWDKHFVINMVKGGGE